jgi:hypothetical protein
MTSPSPQPSFQQSLAITGQWLELWENGELSDEVLADRVAELVVSRDGGRGFFAVGLAGDSPLLDRLPEPLVLALRAVGAPVVDLCLRNLAMSTAMVLHHARSGDPQQQAGSERVASRCTELLRLLEPSQVKQRLETLWAAAKAGESSSEIGSEGSGEGSSERGGGEGSSEGGGNGISNGQSASAALSSIKEDQAFLQRWGYDAEQRHAIACALEAVAE